MGNLSPLKRLRDLPEAWRWALGVGLGSRLVLTLWAALLWSLDLVTPRDQMPGYYWGQQPIVEGWQGALLGVWQHWDAIHFVTIASEGYRIDAPFTASFFPLYPLLGRAATVVTGRGVAGTLTALLLVSTVAFVLALVQLYRLVQEDFDAAVARRTLLVTAILPFAWYFSAPYPSSVRLLAILVSYRAARHGRWTTSTLAGLACGLSHPSGITVIPAVAWEASRRLRRGHRSLGALAAILAPLAGLAGFLLWRSRAEYTGFVAAQEQGHGWMITWPWVEVLRVPKMILFSGPVSVEDGAHLVVFLLVVAMLFYIARRLPIGQTILQGTVILFRLTLIRQATALAGWGRHLLIAFPTYIGLAHWCSTPARRRLLYGLGALLQLITSGLFLTWSWI